MNIIFSICIIDAVEFALYCFHPSHKVSANVLQKHLDGLCNSSEAQGVKLPQTCLS